MEEDWFDAGGVTLMEEHWFDAGGVTLMEEDWFYGVVTMMEVYSLSTFECT